MNRKKLYTLLNIANGELQKTRPYWRDDDYREILRQCGATLKGNKISATTMTIKELEKALTRLRGLGFKVKKKPISDNKKTTSTSQWRKPRIAKLNAMWCAMADAGVINDRSESAMEAWCKHQVPQLNALGWSSSQQLNKLIEQMKAMALQHGLTNASGKKS